MRIIKTKDKSELGKEAAGIIAAQIKAKPDCVLGLATGSSPIETYRELIRLYQNGALDFSHVSTVNLDEYLGLGREDAQSYYCFMNEQLFRHVNIKSENTNIPDGMTTDIERECLRYEALIENLGGIDLQLLGIGHNGHIGFNEPSESFSTVTHCVDLKPSTIEANKRFFDSANDVPRQAISMGIQTILNEGKILLIASGPDKAAILREALLGPVTPEVPASILQLHNHVTIVADEAALSEIAL